jgi:putative redox protein
MRSARSQTLAGKFKQRIEIGPHVLTGDEPADHGGEDAGPEPKELLNAALATCTSMTVKAYADHKGMKLERVDVGVEGEQAAGGWLFKRTVRLEGSLTDGERARLLEIANKCPVHKILSGKIEIRTELQPKD